MLCDQEERVEQLRSFSFLSGVVAGFAVAALLQLQVDVNQTPQSFQMWFSISAGLCVSPLYHSLYMTYGIHSSTDNLSPASLTISSLHSAWQTCRLTTSVI